MAFRPSNTITTTSIVVGNPVTGGSVPSVLTVVAPGVLGQTTATVASTFLMWNGTNFVFAPVGSGNMAIGNVIAGSTDTEVLYTGTGGVLASDNGFTRDAGNNFQTAIQSSDGANVFANFNMTGGIGGGAISLQSIDNGTTDQSRINLNTTFARQSYFAASGAFSISQQAATSLTHTFSDGANITATTTSNATAIDSTWTDTVNTSQVYGGIAQAYIYHNDALNGIAGLVGVADGTVVPTVSRRILFEGAGDTLQIYHPSVIDIQGGGSFMLFDNPNDAFNIGAGSATQSTINGDSFGLTSTFADVTGDTARTILATEATLNFTTGAGVNSLFQASGIEAVGQFDDGTGVTSTARLNATTGSVIFDDQNNLILSTLSVGSTGATLSHDGGQGIVTSVTLDDTQADMRWVSGAGVTAFTGYNTGTGFLTTRLNDTVSQIVSYTEYTSSRATMKFDFTPAATASATVSAEDIQTYMNWSDGIGISNDVTLDADQARLYYSDSGGSIEGYIGVDNSGTPLAFDRGFQVDAANGGSTIKDPTEIVINAPTITFNDGATDNFEMDANGNLRAFNLHNNATAQGNASNQDIRSGTYTPTATALNNYSDVTPSLAQWNRVGNVVTVSGQVLCDAITTATFSSFELSLPVASAITTTAQASGAAFSGAVAEGQQVLSNIANNTAEFWATPVATTAQTFSYTYTYVVL